MTSPNRILEWTVEIAKARASNTDTYDGDKFADFVEKIYEKLSELAQKNVSNNT